MRFFARQVRGSPGPCLFDVTSDSIDTGTSLRMNFFTLARREGSAAAVVVWYRWHPFCREMGNDFGYITRQ